MFCDTLCILSCREIPPALCCHALLQAGTHLPGGASPCYKAYLFLVCVSVRYCLLPLFDSITAGLLPLLACFAVARLPLAHFANARPRTACRLAHSFFGEAVDPLLPCCSGGRRPLPPCHKFAFSCALLPPALEPQTKLPSCLTTRLVQLLPLRPVAATLHENPLITRLAWRSTIAISPEFKASPATLVLVLAHLVSNRTLRCCVWVLCPLVHPSLLFGLCFQV